MGLSIKACGVVVLSVVGLFGSACTNSPSYSQLPRTQAQFCEALDRAKDLYDKADELENSQARSNGIDASRRTRKNALLAALPDGSFIGWSTQVEKVSSSSADLFLEVRPSCRTKVLLKQRTPFNAKDEEFLSSLKNRSWLLVSGSLIPGDELDGFEEGSFTDRGSLGEPEFRAGFALMKPVASAEVRYPDELQPKLAEAVKKHKAGFWEKASHGGTSPTDSADTAPLAKDSTVGGWVQERQMNPAFMLRYKSAMLCDDRNWLNAAMAQKDKSEEYQRTVVLPLRASIKQRADELGRRAIPCTEPEMKHFVPCWGGGIGSLGPGESVDPTCQSVEELLRYASAAAKADKR